MRSSNLITVMVLMVILGGFGFLLYQNAQPAQSLRVVVPTEIPSTSAANPLRDIFSANFGSDTTAMPTIAIPTQPFAAPTLAPASGPTSTLIPAAALGEDVLFTVAPVSVGITPTPLLPTITPAGDDDSPPVQVVASGPTQVWQPPAYSPPLNLDPQGRDHYYFTRPIDSNATNFGIFYYPFGSDGLELDNPSRIHHGIDMPNDIGTTVRAAGSGTVIFASTDDDPYFQGSPSYGNVVVIEHDFGWNGQQLWTLYAHLQSVLVQQGQIVQDGDPIALNGDSGRVSGPHLHFEVRMGPPGRDLRYGDSYNPALWMVPYVGRGTIAGRLVDARDNLIVNQTITLRSYNTGLAVSSTETYTYLDNVNDVNEDPIWQENFVFGDVQAGLYEVVTQYDGQRVSEIVEVFAGRTTTVELKPKIAATARPG